MIIYPWFNKYFKTIIDKYNKKKMHHAILLQTQTGLGVNNLVKNIIKFIILKKKKKIKYTDLILNNPDILYFDKKKKKININTVRKIKEKIYKTNHKLKNKIIWLPQSKNITEQAINALLKILEEPPKNTLFFMTNNEQNLLLPTLRSRFIIYNILNPTREESLKWLNKTNNQKKKNILALTINYDAPILAQKFIKKNIYITRNEFLKNFKKSIEKENFINLLSILKKKTITKINWIYCIFFDCMKYKLKININLINFDQLQLIKKINMKYTFNNLKNSIQIIINLKKYLKTIPTINQELILTNTLLKLNEIL
ncbi:DNA polymerase III subunit delta' C-terminal domain-containing protein [Buchnera aphidicola (Mollitrichosiphum nigrofasciatum)]|uniref:DNA polymerase III subunit delta' C-terminal domain-containing protein n=1 Tax=Buchnera aphidicola TaxID=9 RepID=UPI0031B82504